MTIVDRFNASPLEALLWALALLISVVLHEYGHAWVAIWQGDDTPTKNGRFDWNPARYLDWTGILLFLLIGFGALGYVKTQPWKYRNPVWGSFAVSMAGIVMNIGLVLMAATLLRTLETRVLPFGLDLERSLGNAAMVGGVAYTSSLAPGWVLYFLAQLLSLNVILAVFNALPVPPLDGANALAAIVPGSLGASLRAHLNQSWWLLFIVIIFLREPLGHLIFTVQSWVLNLLF
ncbi:MAG: site-2 protease family protein [Pleurocapsa sp. SU_196_0]|nr:site-2 protease family protein [Pleurocapsa sp. SU_196_0]